MKRIKLAATILLTLLSPLCAGQSVFIDASRELQARFGDAWSSLPPSELSAAIVEMAESLPVGGAIDLPQDVPSGTLDFRRIADEVQVTGGIGGTVIFGAGQFGLELLFSKMNQEIAPGIERDFGRLSPRRPELQLAAKDWNFKDSGLFGENLSPMSDYLALFCSGGIRIKSDVKNCAWIAGDNAFGDHVVTAEARVDDSLFLWFGINWPFRDYNAHWTDGGKTDWVQRGTQMHFNLKGGGAGTRLYHMVETNYGNPGVGVFLENTKGLSLMHGSTERGSAQGPGVYWLKNCEDTLLGLRGINGFGSNSGDARNADANRDITIEGSTGTTLYAIRSWSNSNEVSIWNDDPNLQIWCVAAQYGAKGVENALRFAFTPYYNRPTEEFLAKFDAKAHAQSIYEKRAASLKKEWEKKRSDAEKKKQPFDTPEPKPHESVEQLTAKIKTGRHLNCPGEIEMNATDEETFLFGGADLTKDEKPAGKLPPPPDVPPTDAPPTRRQIAFTQAPDFGKALLAAGADPSGKKPSDDAFAKLLYGMSRGDLQKLLDEADAIDKAIWAMHGGIEEELKAARETNEFKAAREKLALIQKRISSRSLTAKQNREEKVKAVQSALKEAKNAKDAAKVAQLESDLKALEATNDKGSIRLEIPPGTFLLKQPLYLLGGISGIFGAGEKTTLRTDEPIHLVKMQERCTVACLSLEGGTVGLALTGADHHYNDGAPSKKSYIAGENFYAITFRNQSFAGMHIGNEDTGAMGGAEHDQNKYVDLKFENTGDYGIFFNNSMLDKWLVLHCDFAGQKKAGISIKFNNLIHGMIVASKFSNISGPGIDTFGGNVEIGYRPWEVWIDECEFTECGSESAFAVEMGITELSAFTHSKIETKNKKIAGGYAGSPQIFEDCTVNVSLLPDAPAVKLRAVRTESVVRANGHVVRNVTANGPLVFVNDANAQGEHFAKTIEILTARGKPHVEKWDTNSMAHQLAPRNGWVHPFVFYKSVIGGESFAYALLNVDVDSGKVKERKELQPFE